MDISKLSATHNQLIEYMEQHGYSLNYINEIRKAIRFILCSNNDSWKNYDDAFLAYCCAFPNCKRTHRSAINTIAKFDLWNLYPDGGRIQAICRNDSYSLLNDEYKQFVDDYQKYCRSLNLTKTTVNNKTKTAAAFLYHIQNYGCKTFSDVTESAVLSVFYSKSEGTIKSHGYKNEIKFLMKYGMEQNIYICQDILNYLPDIRMQRKNIQYLTNDEITAIKVALNDYESGLSLRDRAIGVLLLYTGLRASDIASLRFASIDWKKDLIYIRQEKTEENFTIPLRPIVGNSIYEYLEKERPRINEPYIFISTLKPYRSLKPCSLKSIVKRIFRAADIRQNAGSIGSTHLFRHRFTAALLEADIAQPVITNALGHVSPKSVEPYLNADFDHLKKCAIEITDFPVCEEVFII